MQENDNLNNTTETMMRIYFGIRNQPNTNPDDLAPTTLTAIRHLAKWYRSVEPADDDRASDAITLLEVLAVSEDSFWADLEELIEDDELDPLPPLPRLSVPDMSAWIDRYEATKEGQ